jgi:hypothetical protein
MQGFSLYLTLAAKNYFYEGKTESRWLDLTIVCNLMYSSGPPDLAGAFRRMGGECDDMEKAALTYDATNLNRTSVSITADSKAKKKGDKPLDKDQKKWAPLHYFVPAVAGSLIAMTNKLGSWNMGLSPGVKAVSGYVFSLIHTRLRCLVSEYDENNASRYYESYLCRCVADTIYKTTFSNMMSSDKVNDAVYNTMRGLCYNALDISLLPSLFDRIIQRMVQFEPLLAAATIGLCIDVPVVSILSIKQFLDGQYIDDRKEYELLRNFSMSCWNKNMFMNKVSP